MSYSSLKRYLFKSSMFQLGPYVFVFCFLFQILLARRSGHARLKFSAIICALSRRVVVVQLGSLCLVVIGE